MFVRDSTARLPALLLLLSASAGFGADAKPVAHVGPAAISDEALTRRLRKIPDFQRQALADTPDKLKRQVLDTWLVPELLYAQEAERLKLEQRPNMRVRERELLRQALEHELRAETAAKNPVTPGDIQAYFEANRGRFETPRRIHVWRILTDDEALAKKILADCKGVDGIKQWSQFARDNSLDKATHLRNGDLGFVHADGNTDTPTLRVDAALFAEAAKLADGELAAAPIQEGTHFAAIWRRGSMKASSRTIAQESGSIRQVLERQRVEQARDALLASLRGKYVSANNEALLENFAYTSAGVPERPVSSARPAHAAPAGSSTPMATPNGRDER
ncbi:MAG TPA: peptidylprolyl isomerase [Polyangiaceae bacterium]|jgi:peptidyl-prolyl cis-trans isomerase C|nr:peptidylprolyl isomerase [Polyangiaceae bacterium]